MCKCTEYFQTWLFSEEDDNEAINWLKHNNGPQSVVSEKMRKTARMRHHWIKEDSPDTTQILEKYPRLLDPGMVNYIIL